MTLKSAALAVALLSSAAAVAAQEPKQGPTPQQLKVERQNEIMKLQIHQQTIRDKTQLDVNACNQQIQKAQQSVSDDDGKIEAAKVAGLKELGLDPDKYLVQDGTFYVVEKPAPAPPPAATPKK